MRATEIYAAESWRTFSISVNSALSPIFSLLIRAFAARWLGAGLALEGFFAVMAGLYALLLLALPSNLATDAARDVAAAYGLWIIIPMVAKSALTGGGIALNILGRRLSRPMRIGGACLGVAIWSCLALKMTSGGELGGFWLFCVLATAASVRIWAMATANIPEPGLMQAYDRLFRSRV